MGAFQPGLAEPAQLAALLVQAYEIDGDTARRDAGDFLKECVEKKLLRTHA